MNRAKNQAKNRAINFVGWGLTLLALAAVIFGPLTGSLELYIFGVIVSLSAIAVANLR